MFSGFIGLMAYMVYMSDDGSRSHTKGYSQKKFSKALREELKSGAVASLDDVVNLYGGSIALKPQDLTHRYGLTKHLRQFLVELLAKDEHASDTTPDDSAIQQWKEKLSQFIRENETAAPYADLPTPERDIMTDISKYVEDHDSESIRRKSLELSAAIQARNDSLRSAQRTNTWSVPTSIAGLILTIVFGIMAIVQ
jgi:hypothetical protein